MLNTRSWVEFRCVADFAPKRCIFSASSFFNLRAVERSANLCGAAHLAAINRWDVLGGQECEVLLRSTVSAVVPIRIGWQGRRPLRVRKLQANELVHTVCPFPAAGFVQLPGADCGAAAARCQTIGRGLWQVIANKTLAGTLQAKNTAWGRERWQKHVTRRSDKISIEATHRPRRYYTPVARFQRSLGAFIDVGPTKPNREPPVVAPILVASNVGIAAAQCTSHPRFCGSRVHARSEGRILPPLPGPSNIRKCL